MAGIIVFPDFLITPYLFPILTIASAVLLLAEDDSAEKLLAVYKRIVNTIDLNVKLIKNFIM